MLVHTEGYINRLSTSGEGYIDPDTFLRRDTYGISLLSAGGAIEAVRKAAEHGQPTFAMVRPPGHHAGADYGGGFCYFNNVAIAARHLARKRTMIVDLDVHHGNGTEEIFYPDDSVLYLSTHQEGIYPGTGMVTDVGTGSGKGFTINIPFRSGTGDGSFSSALNQVVLPVLEQFDPEIVLVSLGVDAHYKDPLASLNLSSGGYIELMAALIDAAPGGRIAFVLEGGYHIGATAEVLTGLVALIQGKQIELEYAGPTDERVSGGDRIDEVVRVQNEFWNLG